MDQRLTPTQKKLARKAASTRSAAPDSGFNPAFWCGLAVAIALSVSPVDITAMLGIPWFAPFLPVLEIIAIAICIFIGTVGQHIRLQWPLKSGIPTNVIVMATLLLLAWGIYSSHVIDAAEMVGTLSTYHSRPPIEQPQIAANDFITVTFGSMNAGRLTWPIAGAASILGIGFNGYSPVKYFAKGGKICIDATIYNHGAPPRPNSPILVNCNALVRETLPWGWDYNSDGRMLEVVDSKTRPIFQLIFDEPNHIIVRGVFPIPPGEVCRFDSTPVSPMGSCFKLPDKNVPPMQMMDPITNVLSEARPLFKYPAYLHPGELNDR